MWGQTWGQMVWSGLRAVPALTFWAEVALGALLLAVGQHLIARGVRRRTVAALLAGVLLILPLGSAMASLPFTFVNGTVADATQVNGDFSALDSRVAALQTRVAVSGVQRTSFQYGLADPNPTMTLSLAAGSYTLTAAGCGSPSGGTFLIEATLQINGTNTDSAVLNPSNFDCFTLINAVTFTSAASVAVVFSNAGGQGGAEASINWARLIAVPVDSASISTVTN